MGQKVDPRAFRLGHLRGWNSLWFASKNEYRAQLLEDLKIRKYLKKQLKTAGVNQVDIDRQPNAVSIIIYTSRPGIVIGRGGAGIEEVRNHINTIVSPGTKISVDVHEIRHPDMYAQLIAGQVAEQLEKRMSFRRVLKKTADRVMGANEVQGVRIRVSGRLDGADMSRTEQIALGKIPLHTIRADIDYATAEAVTTYSTIGVKVWIYRGEVLNMDEAMEKQRRLQQQAKEGRSHRRRQGGRPSRNAMTRGARPHRGARSGAPTRSSSRAAAK